MKTKEEIKEYRNEYYKKNKEKELLKQREYEKENAEKISERKNEYYHKNIEKLKEYHKEYYEKNKEKISQEQIEYRKLNKDKRSIYSKEWREKNAEKIATKKSEWYINNKDKRREYIENNKEKFKEKRSKYWKKVKYEKYDITEEDYQKMFEAQNGECMICGTHQDKFNYSLHIDHNHKTNKVRGLLCFKCNNGIGFFNDDVELLGKVIEYLNKFK